MDKGDYVEYTKEYFDRCRELADCGDVRSISELAYFYFYGQFVVEDHRKAAELWLKAAEKGDALAQNAIACSYQDGDGVEQDTKKAIYWHEQSAQNGNILSFHALAHIYSSGIGIEPDKSKAVSYWYKVAVADGCPAQHEAEYNIAQSLFYGTGIEIDQSEAIRWYEKSANGGFVEAMTTLAYRYENGEGTDLNIRKAMSWYRKASDAGDHNATLNLANIYLMGKGIPKNAKRANELLQKAAEAGNGMAASSLGRNYTIGEGVPQSLQDAEYWIKLGERLGYINSDTMCNLGIMYKQQKRYEEAFQCYKKALDVDSSNVNAQFMYGQSLYFGRGTEMNHKKARPHLEFCISRNPNDTDAKRILEGIRAYDQLEYCIDTAMTLLQHPRCIEEIYFSISIYDGCVSMYCHLERWDNHRNDDKYNSYLQNVGWKAFETTFDEVEIKSKPVSPANYPLTVDDCQYKKLIRILSLSKDVEFKYVLRMLGAKYNLSDFEISSDSIVYKNLR